MNLWIYTDADNTLWDTDAVFARAQLALLQAAEDLAGSSHLPGERLQFVREYDQAIAARHHSRLRYPPALLVRALCEGIGGSSPEAAAQRAIAQGSVPTDAEEAAVNAYLGILAGVPPILPGVRAGLELAHKRSVPLYVISEGSIESMRARLQALELESLISGTLSAAKTPELYVRLKQRAAPHQAIMIGDQSDRDIRFAHEAGLQTVLVQGRFRPRWIRSVDTARADAVVDDFLEAIKCALEWDLPATK